MEIFSFNADVGNESADDFNKRLYDFCCRPDAPIVNVVSTAFHGGVVLTLSTSEELPIQLPLMIVPVIRPIGIAEAPMLESVLSEFAADLREIQDSDGNSVEPIEMRMIESRGAKHLGYAVAIINFGEIEYDAAQGEGE